MELIEPKSFFYTILLFFSGCMAFQKPEPVTIQAPTTVSHQKLQTPADNEVILMLEFDNSKTVYYSIEVVEKKIANRVRAFDQQKIGEAIEKAVQLSKQQKKELRVLIKGDNTASSKQFESLIQILTKKGLTRFQLVTDPEK
jgi:biopolymer transport protein ExbD